MHWMKPLLLVGLAGFAARPTRVELMPADAMLQIYAQRARQDAVTGNEIQVTDEMFTKIRETFKEYPIVCSKPHVKAVSAYVVPSTPKDWDAVALSGRGLCYCTMLGNCRLWVYRQKKDKMQKIFATDSAAYFGFLSSRTGTPLLVVWTRESAVEQFAVVYKWDYGEYIEAASWKEVYEYEDPGEEYRVHDTPRIYSDMPLGVFLPD